MSEEIPPSSLATKPEPAPLGASGDLLYTLRLTDERWRGLLAGTPAKGALTAGGAWLILAWNRFGFQGISAPRAVTRFILVGIYSWLAVAIVCWLAAVLLDRFGSSSEAQATSTGSLPDPIRILRVTGMAHQPLLVFAVTLQIGQALPIPWITTVFAVLFVLAWMPAMLCAALASALGRSFVQAIPIAAVGYLVWLLTGGRYMLDLSLIHI